MNNSIIIIGAGGHAKVVAEAILLQKKYSLIGFLDDSVAKDTAVFENYKCLGNSSDIKGTNASHFVVAIGNNTIRKAKFDALVKETEAAVIIHPNAIVSANSKIGAGSVVLAGAIVSYGASIGMNCIVNSLSLTDHETRIGDHTHVAQGAIIGSNCSLPALHPIELGQKINSYTNLT